MKHCHRRNPFQLFNRPEGVNDSPPPPFLKAPRQSGPLGKASERTMRK